MIVGLALLAALVAWALLMALTLRSGGEVLGPESDFDREVRRLREETEKLFAEVGAAILPVLERVAAGFEELGEAFRSAAPTAKKLADAFRGLRVDPDGRDE